MTVRTYRKKRGGLVMRDIAFHWWIVHTTSGRETEEVGNAVVGLAYEDAVGNGNEVGMLVLENHGHEALAGVAVVGERDVCTWALVGQVISLRSCRNSEHSDPYNLGLVSLDRRMER